MKLISNIYQLYEDVGKEILQANSDKLKIVCEKHVNQLTGCFTVTLEIIVISKILHDDDYGIVFSTNAQKESHNGISNNQFISGLYLTSDLSLGDGQIIDGIEELDYSPSNEENNSQIWDAILNFTLSKIRDVKKILTDKNNIYT